jgi:hypothetical protein
LRRLSSDVTEPGRELRVVDLDGADPDRHRVRLAAPAVDQLAALSARDPLGVPGLGGDLAVERHGRLEQHVGAAGARVLAKRLV